MAFRALISILHSLPSRNGLRSTFLHFPLSRIHHQNLEVYKNKHSLSRLYSSDSIRAYPTLSIQMPCLLLLPLCASESLPDQLLDPYAPLPILQHLGFLQTLYFWTCLRVAFLRMNWICSWFISRRFNMSYWMDVLF